MGEATELALAALTTITERRDEYDKINRSIRKMHDGDFSDILTLIDHKVEKGVVALLDAMLGDEIASYWLYEASTMRPQGGAIVINGRRWRIASMDDVRAFVARRPSPGDAP